MKNANPTSLGIITALVAALWLGCAHHLPLEASQRASVSAASAAFLAKTTVVDPSSFIPISASRLLDARKDYDATERVREDEIIAAFGLTVESTTIAGVRVIVIKPKTVSPKYEDVIGFHIHGGAFFLGTARERSALLMAADMGIPVHSVEYSLTPEAKFPVALDQCFSVYKSLVQQFTPSRIVASSFSAGGNLMLLTLQRAEREGVALPKAQILYSPLTDVTTTGDSKVTNDGRDILPVGLVKRIVGNFYLGGADAAQPAVSPLYGTYSAGFPSTVIVTGTRDFLLSDSVRLQWKLMSVGVKTELLVGEGMWHGFAIEYRTPESIAARKEVVRFLDAELGSQRMENAPSTLGDASQ